MKLSIATTRQENLLGFIYLGFSQLLLPSLIAVIAYLWGYPITMSQLNIIYFFINFICVVAIFHRFLGKSTLALFRSIPQYLISVVVGFGIYYWVTMLVGILISLVDPEFANVNDQSIADLSQEYPGIISFATVFLVPVVEETLYRGLIFQNLQRKHRVLAYVISSVVFASIHVVGYIGSADWMTLGLCFVQYLPAGIALGWAYEKADTIAAPILIHIIINQIGMSTLR